MPESLMIYKYDIMILKLMIFIYIHLYIYTYINKIPLCCTHFYVLSSHLTVQCLKYELAASVASCDEKCCEIVWIKNMELELLHISVYVKQGVSRIVFSFPHRFSWNTPFYHRQHLPPSNLKLHFILTHHNLVNAYHVWLLEAL